jgi:hypothetical protein
VLAKVETLVLAKVEGTGAGESEEVRSTVLARGGGGVPRAPKTKRWRDREIGTLTRWTAACMPCSRANAFARMPRTNAGLAGQRPGRGQSRAGAPFCREGGSARASAQVERTCAGASGAHVCWRKWTARVLAQVERAYSGGVPRPFERDPPDGPSGRRASSRVRRGPPTVGGRGGTALARWQPTAVPSFARTRRRGSLADPRRRRPPATC